ncbi:hypothetical protein RUE5091_00059 [Ruegeria denitrificans]|uniref:Uncharacterized protein n=1 Tax=Ruegeria denitrificans TaxID=1715692 RepID=A0A0P1I0G5_9RHOB|nr:hypothetical protein [Ruegeria denitrificans]CUJ83011.1 hypothetical protein RUE5091_00059 [Ruegeria denitrificans]
MFRTVAIVCLTLVAQIGYAQEGVLARCGASKGTGYFFKDELVNPDGPEWADDGISKGKIVLVKLGDEWDIQFDDTAGSYGYREDGATVFPVGSSGSKLTIAAMHPNYSDIYTFNFAEGEVLWTSHKIGTATTKVAIYRAECAR